MKSKSVNFIFICIGVLIGIILALQVRAQPVKVGSFPLDQLEVQKSILNTLATEQEQLKHDLSTASARLAAAKKVLEKRTSRQTLNVLTRLKELTGFNAVTGPGIRIVLNDNPNVSRLDFSVTDEHFVQASDLRDFVNGLALKDARAISINGKRILPMIPIRSIFDSILIGNFQITSPFTIEAVGNPIELQDALTGALSKRKIQMMVDYPENITIKPTDGLPQTNFLTLMENEKSADNN